SRFGFGEGSDSPVLEALGGGAVVAELVDADAAGPEGQRLECLGLDGGEIVERGQADGDVRDVVLAAVLGDVVLDVVNRGVVDLGLGVRAYVGLRAAAAAGERRERVDQPALE